MLWIHLSPVPQLFSLRHWAYEWNHFWMIPLARWMLPGNQVRVTWIKKLSDFCTTTFLPKSLLFWKLFVGEVCNDIRIWSTHIQKQINAILWNSYLKHLFSYLHCSKQFQISFTAIACKLIFRLNNKIIISLFVSTIHLTLDKNNIFYQTSIFVHL